MKKKLIEISQPKPVPAAIFAVLLVQPFDFCQADRTRLSIFDRRQGLDSAHCPHHKDRSGFKFLSDLDIGALIRFETPPTD
jgi:hypothetical protein